MMRRDGSVRVLIAVAFGYQLALGASLLLVPHAFGSPSYSVLFALASPKVHGVLFVFAGLVAGLALKCPGWTRLALGWAAGMSLSWAASFLGAAFLGTLLGPSAPITYGAVAAIYTGVLWRGGRP